VAHRTTLLRTRVVALTSVSRLHVAFTAVSSSDAQDNRSQHTHHARLQTTNADDGGSREERRTRPDVSRTPAPREAPRHSLATLAREMRRAGQTPRRHARRATRASTLEPIIDESERHGSPSHKSPPARASVGCVDCLRHAVVVCESSAQPPRGTQARLLPDSNIHRQ